MMEFRFQNLHKDVPVLSAPHEFLLRIVADFSIWVRDRLLYEEQEFCVVEFAQQLDHWLQEEEEENDFEYEAADAEEPGLVWLRFEKDGWRIGSLFQEYPELREFSRAEIRQAAEAFMRKLDSQLEETFGTRLRKIFESVAAQ